MPIEFTPQEPSQQPKPPTPDNPSSKSEKVKALGVCLQSVQTLIEGMGLQSNSWPGYLRMALTPGIHQLPEFWLKGLKSDVAMFTRTTNQLSEDILKLNGIDAAELLQNIEVIKTAFEGIAAVVEKPLSVDSLKDTEGEVVRLTREATHGIFSLGQKLEKLKSKEAHPVN